MALLLVSFLGGVLTVLAPCILPLLPVIVGGTAAGVKRRSAPFVIIGSLGLSIILFTYLLKASTAFIAIPPEVWTTLSGAILMFFGLTLLFPVLWEKIPGLNRLSSRSNLLLGQGAKQQGFWGDVVIGAALGPIFSTCSPTYFVILASVLPVSFALGTLYLFSYVLGLSLVLLAIALLGQKLVRRLGKAADPQGWLKRVLGVLFVVLGFLIASGLEKKIEIALLDGGFFDVTKVEQRLLKDIEMPADNEGMNGAFIPSNGPEYKEIVAPAGFINVENVRIGDLIGKKIVLVDIWTYSCINCQRTIPYLNAWYDKYRDQGLEIIGVHSPEFAFERNIDNVRKAVRDFGIEYPVVLDNDFGTWRAYGNQYWPRKYLIDINGRIIYDHAGEGEYDEAEKAIQQALRERADQLGMQQDVSMDMAQPTRTQDVEFGKIASPEIYFGSGRNGQLGNGIPGVSGQQSFSIPDERKGNKLYLGGTWDLDEEYAQSVSPTAQVSFSYKSKDVYMVAEADSEVLVRIRKDGVVVKTISVRDSQLYHLIADDQYGAHELRLEILSPGLRAYTFTFG